MNSVEVASPVGFGMSSESSPSFSFVAAEVPSFESVLAQAQTSVLLAQIGRVEDSSILTYAQTSVLLAQAGRVDVSSSGSTDEPVLAYAQRAVLLAQIGRVDIRPAIIENIEEPVDLIDSFLQTTDQPNIQLDREKEAPEIKILQQPEVPQPLAQPDTESPTKITNPIAEPVPKVAPQVESRPELEVYPATQASPVVDIQQARQHQLQPALELEKTVLKKEQEKEVKKLKRTTEQGLNKKRLVIDKPVLAIRLFIGRLAAKLAFQRAHLRGERVVSGEDVLQFVPEEYDEVRSGSLKEDTDRKLPDGSYELMGTDIRQVSKTASEAELRANVEAAISAHKPLIRVEGSIGEPAQIKQRDEVYLYTPKKPPVEEVVVYEKEAKVIKAAENQPEFVQVNQVVSAQASAKEALSPKPKIVRAESLGLTEVKSLG